MEIAGTVKRYARQNVRAEYRNVLLEGQTEFVTIGKNQGRHPQIGDSIIVTGKMKDGKFLTESWDYDPHALPHWYAVMM